MTSESKPDAPKNITTNPTDQENKDPTQPAARPTGAPAAVGGEKLRDFAALKAKEVELLRQRRKVAFGASDAGGNSDAGETPTKGDCDEPNDKLDDVVGLALSGGGLRSALFNDGFLRALSHSGLLRYIDYLCSVSGGGYIAGHLMTKATVKAEGDSVKAENFHASEPESTVGDADPAWWLGVHPTNGQVASSHLPNVGSYLQSTWEGIVGFTRHQLTTKCVYIGILGTVATLLAIYFRSFDDPIYRSVISDDIGELEGGEIMYSFIPTIGVLFLLMFCIAFDASIRVTSKLRNRSDSEETQNNTVDLIARHVVGLLLFVSIVFLVTSFAVSIGNSLTSTSKGQPDEMHLNYFANYIALIAGAIQILVFLGRDRLFKSEKSEAANWQKAAQSVVTFAVLGMAFFAFVHFMACENVSHFTYHRDPFLLRGEVMDWKRMHSIAQQALVETQPQSKEENAQEKLTLPSLASIDPELYRKQAYPSRTHRYLARNLANGQQQSLFGEDSSEDSSPPIPEDFRIPQNERSKLNHAMQFALYSFLPRSLADPIGGGLGERAARMHRNQQKFVEQINERLLVSPKFTAFLLRAIKIEPEGEESSESEPTFTDLFVDHIDSNSDNERDIIEEMLLVYPDDGPMHIDHEWMDEHTRSWSETSRNRFAALFQKYVQRLHSPSADESSDRLGPNSHFISAESTRRLETAELNHFLLELVGSKLLVSHDDISTHYIQPHDQQARYRWLAFWLAVLGFGLLMTLDLNAVVYAYNFYRERITRHFLSAKPRGRFSGETRLADLKPTEHGLPFPIYQAAWQRPNRAAGSFQIESENVTCTPLGIHLWERKVAGYQVAREEVAREEAGLEDRSNQTAAGVCEDKIKLKDAVAISGSAVTPLMTNNLALAVILDFFGGRIGRWLNFENQPPEDEANRRIRKEPLVIVLAVVAMGCVGFVGLNFGLRFVAVLVCVTAIIGYVYNLGYPYLLANMFLPRKTRTGSSGEGIGETLQCWPRAFVADGGFYDFLGVNELIRRRCRLIVVSDAGVNSGEHTLSSLAKMCHSAAAEQGVRFFDMDHDAPIDFGRLNRDDRRLVAQPFLAMRIKYPGPDEEFGFLFYAQMAITESDPIEIQQIRHCFPSFPDEPTTNQFYTPEQVEAYQHLGYHIGNRLCNNMQRWTESEIWNCSRSDENSFDGNSQPLLGDVLKRLNRAYVQACYEELSYREDDVYGESIWTGNASSESKFPSFRSAVYAMWEQGEKVHKRNEPAGPETDEEREAREKLELPIKRQVICETWIQTYMTNADVEAAYLESVCCVVNQDIFAAPNEYDKTFHPANAVVRGTAFDDTKPIADFVDEFDEPTKMRYAAHLAALAVGCQQLHRGAPSNTFQIGGRKKLVSIVQKIAEDISGLPNQINNIPGDQQDAEFAKRAANAVVNEIIEMKSCVFVDADDQASVSFAQCLCRELALWYRLNHFGDHFGDAATSRVCTDFRQLFAESLKSGYVWQSRQLLMQYIHVLTTGIPEDVQLEGTALVKQMPIRRR